MWKYKSVFSSEQPSAGFPDLEDEVIQQIRRAPLNITSCKDADHPVYEVSITLEV